MMCEEVMNWSWSSWRSPKDSKILHHLILTKNIVHPSNSDKNNALQGNPTCPERTSSSIHTTLLGLDWDSDDKSCSLFEEVLVCGLTNGWWYFGRRRAGSQMLGACNRMWVHVWCGTPGCIHSYIAKGLEKGLGRSWLSPPLIEHKATGVISWGCALYPESCNAW